MRIRLRYFILTLVPVFFIACGTDPRIKGDSASDSDTLKIKSDIAQLDSIDLKESFNEEDLPANEYLMERLKPIRANFKRINSITKWTSTRTEELWETTEGGHAVFYFQNGSLEKITTRHYGETFQKLTEFYLLKGQLSFVLEKLYKYNRPMYYDSADMIEMNDTEAFDFERSEIIEDRSYFENGTLIHQLNNQDCAAPFADDYLLEEQKRILSYFEGLLIM